MMSDSLLWKPTPERIAGTQLTLFENRLRDSFPDIKPGYQGLHDWSVHHADDFWQALVDDLCIVGDWTGPVSAETSEVVGRRFFPESRLNFAENMLARGNPESLAIIEHREDGRRRQVTYETLRARGPGYQGFWKAAIASPVLCRTVSKQWSVCWQRVSWEPSGHPARPISV